MMMVYGTNKIQSPVEEKALGQTPLSCHQQEIPFHLNY